MNVASWSWVSRKLANLLESGLSVFSAVLLFAMMLLYTVDVGLRYGFSRPIFGGDELQTYLLGAAVVAGMGLVTKDGGHIVVSLFEERLLRHARLLYRGLFHCFNLLGMAFIVYALFRQGLYLASVEQRSLVLQAPVGRITLAIAVVAGLGLLLCVLNAGSRRAPEAAAPGEAERQSVERQA